MEITIEEYLAPFHSSEISYVPNPGNAGDSIIALGTIQKLTQLGIRYKLVDRHRLSLDDHIVFYGGGGNIAYANFSVNFIRRVHSNVKKLVILPHTIHSIDSLLKDFGDNVDIICREKVSYEYVQQSKTKAHVYLAKDMAFHLNVNQALSYKASLVDKISQSIRYIFCKLHLSTLQAPTKTGLRVLINQPSNKKNNPPTLNAFRTDGEKTDFPLPKDNIDISEVFALGTETEVMIKESSSRFLRYINQFEIINTNRLHVAISATLLGKKVNFYPNNYFKCQAVYDYSLRGYSNLTWHDKSENTLRNVS